MKKKLPCDYDSDAILCGLNENQCHAVTYGDGPLLVLAGAGSGKTRVLTHRIAYYIAQGRHPYHFLAVTFTNKAAEEMRTRIRKLVNAEVWVSTFHSSCLRILKAEHTAAGLDTHFSVYDETDQLALVKECLRELTLDDKQYVPKTIRERINRIKDDCMSPKEYASHVETYYDEVVQKIYLLYEKKLTTYKALDFGGLISKCIELLRNNKKILHRYQERFQCILVDEYQDTNHAQYQWIQLLAAQHKNVTVVGDPDQSIYGWRGADISNILSFEKDYPQATIIRLDKNYRSTKTILDASNALIRHNVSRKDKDLWTDQEGGELLSLYEVRDEKEEALFLIEKIMELRHAHVRLDSIVVFYRVHAQSRILEDYLRKYNIPYRIVGGVRFYDRKEIKDVLAYLKVIASPSDEVSLRRIMNVPTRGIGLKAMRLLDAQQEMFGMPLYTLLSEINSMDDVPPRTRTALHTFYSIIEDLRKKKDTLMPSELVREMLESTGYLSMLEKDPSIESQSRVENIRELIGVIGEFEEMAHNDHEGGLLEAFLNMISLQTSIDTWEHDDGVLTLMTMHCAKGLEFDSVFIVGMEEDIFPHMNVLGSSTRELEEERRLCYVALTRAKKRIFLSCAQSRRLYGTRMYNLPSRFLREIPPQYFAYRDSEIIFDRAHDEEYEDSIEYDIW